jgi:hypothetical protein
MPTHFLLYLNRLAYMGMTGEALANEIRTARLTRLPIMMIHENERPGEARLRVQRIF